MDLESLLKIVTIIGAISTTSISIATFFIAKDIRHETNSMKDELVAVTRSDALQIGNAQGKATEKAAQALRNEVVK